MKIGKEGNYYKILKDDGTPVVLSCNEAGLLVNFIGKENLRINIDARLEEAECDWLDLSDYDGTRDDFIQEIFDDLEDEIDYGNSVSDELIDERINDLGTFYNLERGCE